MAATIGRLLRSQHLSRVLSRHALVADTVSKVDQYGRQPCRGYPTSKHWDLKWRLLRKKKEQKADLPKFTELKKDSEKKDKTLDEVRMEMKKEGRLPPRSFQELPLNMSCTRSVIDPYKPPEGDGKQSLLSTSALSENVSRMMKGPKTLKHVRTLKKYEDFVESEFAEEAQNIVLEAQTLLQDVYANQDRLHELVTERAFPEMVHGLEKRTVKWKLVETVEPARVVQIRTEEMITSDNMFAQITVRLHTKQVLAIYDRFGRLMYGDPFLPKSVVEYVIMEKWISDTYGRWRIHGKIIPDWMAPRDSLLKTFKVPVFDPLPPAEPDDEKEGDKNEKRDNEDYDEDESRKGDGPKLVPA